MQIHRNKERWHSTKHDNYKKQTSKQINKQANKHTNKKPNNRNLQYVILYIYSLLKFAAVSAKMLIKVKCLSKI